MEGGAGGGWRRRVSFGGPASDFFEQFFGEVLVHRAGRFGRFPQEMRGEDIEADLL
jgi:hypothetical protein